MNDDALREAAERELQRTGDLSVIDESEASQELKDRHDTAVHTLASLDRPAVDALDIKCPRCDVNAGYPCVRMSQGMRKRKPHRARRLATLDRPTVDTEAVMSAVNRFVCDAAPNPACSADEYRGHMRRIRALLGPLRI